MKRFSVLLVVLMALYVQSSLKNRERHSKKTHKAQYLFSKIKSRKNTLAIDPFATNKRAARKVVNTGATAPETVPPLFNSTFLEEYKRVVSQVFLFRRLKDHNEIEDSLLGEKMLTLNQYGLYVHEPKDKTLNGLEDMIRLDQMITDNDVNQVRDGLPTLDGIVQPIELAVITSQTFQGQFPCFQIIDRDVSESQWQICDYMNTFGDEKLGARLALFRQAIINKVIMHIQWKNKMRFSIQIALTDDDKFGQKDGFDDWSYEKQDLWRGACSEGLQSPIDIIESEVLTSTSQIQAHPNYEGDADAYAFQGMNDRYLVGNFGYLVYLNQIEEEGFFMCPWRVEFKYNAEHVLNSAVPDALEILVYHKKNPTKYNGDKGTNNCEKIVAPVLSEYKEIKTEQAERDAMDSHTDLVLSFLVTPNATLTAEESGVFWQGMAVTNLVSEDESLQKPLSMTPLASPKAKDNSLIANMEGLIDDGLKARFPYSFYYYVGSITQPGCKSDVIRIVMYNKIDANVDLFNSLKSKVLDGYAHKQNFRKPSNEGTNSMKGFRVLKHIDTAQKQNCPTSQIMKSYENPDYARKMAPGEYLDYKKLIAGLTAKEQKFSSAYEALNAQSSMDSLKKTEVKKSLVEFNHIVDIKTKVHHVHKVPRKLIKKIFKKEEVGHGESTTIGIKGSDGFDITYLGENLKAYNTEVANPNEDKKGLSKDQKDRIDTANTIIDKQDKEYLDKDEPEPRKVINQNNLPSVDKEQLAPYLVDKKDDDKDDKKPL